MSERSADRPQPLGLLKHDPFRPQSPRRCRYHMLVAFGRSDRGRSDRETTMRRRQAERDGTSHGPRRSTVTLDLEIRELEPVEIVSKAGTAFLVSSDQWRALMETAYLLRSPANAERPVPAGRRRWPR